MIYHGQIIGADAGGLTVRIPYADWERFTRQNSTQVLCEIVDGRGKTDRQRRFAWALMTDIGQWAGYKAKSQVQRHIYREYFLPRFRLQIMPTLREKAVSLSTMTEAECVTFVNLLVDFAVENGVETKEPMTQYTDDITHYVYSCLMHKRCAVCGGKADLHHVDAVGMGRDRTQINHIGLRCLPLCRVHHNEAHNIGNEPLINKYHLEPIAIDEAIVKTYKLKGANK